MNFTVIRMTLRGVGVGITVLALGAKVLSGEPAAAFTVGHFQTSACALGYCQSITFIAAPNHEDMTARALFPLRPTLSDGTKLRFGSAVILYIKERNADTASLYWSTAKFHF